MKLLLVTLALGLTLVDGFGRREFVNKSREDACRELYPQHGINMPSTAPSPYTLTVTGSGRSRQVTISGSEPFRGFILQAQGGQGNFTALAGQPPFKFVPCAEGTTIRHADPADKTNLTVVWNGDNVAFKGSALKEWDTFFKISA